MADEQIQGQQKAFEEVKNSLAKELSPEMLLWDFSKMMEELRRVIRSVGTNTNDKVRFFARHNLNMAGERHKEVRRWLKGEVMSAEEIRLVFTALSRIDKGNVETVARQQSVQKALPKVSESKVIAESTSNVARKIVDHTVGTLYSLVGLIAEAQIKPENVFGSDRGLAQTSMQKICDHFGIAVKFREPKAEQFEPLTQDDLAEIGFGKERKKK